MYLVVWNGPAPDSDAGEDADQWSAHHTFAQAKTEYDRVVAKGAFIASICAPIVSTDYRTPRDAMLHAERFED